MDNFESSKRIFYKKWEAIDKEIRRGRYDLEDEYFNIKVPFEMDEFLEKRLTLWKTLKTLI